MAQIILDIGSGNTCKNQNRTVRKLFNAIKAVDTGKHEVILKAQLFQCQPPNALLDHQTFRYMYAYGNELGYRVTASVFDMVSLHYLLKFEVPFIKIACRPDLYWLIGEIPRRIPVYVSYNPVSLLRVADMITQPHDIEGAVTKLLCVPKYPADPSDYGIKDYPYVSDHTIGLELWNQYLLDIWEKHIRLPDSTGLDAGTFASTPDELSEIL